MKHLIFIDYSSILKKSYKTINLKYQAPTWNKEFELPDRSYSVSDIQEYFEYIFRKHGEKNDNSSTKIYVNKIENRITIRIKRAYYLELLTPKTMKLLESIKSEINKTKMVKMFLT